jgi:ligand-binding sensor protein
MELTDILPAEDWIRFEKELFDQFDLNCTVYNTSGTGITAKPNWCNPLCPKIKANKESLAVICAAGNQNFMARAKHTKKPVIDECDAGLLKIAVPIFANGEFLGTAGGCGRLPENGELETFIVQKTTGLSDVEINELSSHLKPMSKQKARELAEFIETRIDLYLNEHFKQS